MYILDSLTNIITSEQLNQLRDFLKTSKWNYKVPGGFIQISQRQVNTYGDVDILIIIAILEVHTGLLHSGLLNKLQMMLLLKLKQNLFQINYVGLFLL